MRKILQIIALAVAVLGAPATAEAVTYNIAYDGNIFDVDATVTTDNAGNALSISGTMSGPGNWSSNIVGLVPFSSSSYHNLWIWNNRFTAAAPHVDWYGLLWQTADGMIANLFLDGGNYILSAANPSIGNYSYWINGSVGGAPTVTAVPLPGAVWLLGTGVAGLGYLKRRSRRTGSASSAAN